MSSSLFEKYRAAIETYRPTGQLPANLLVSEGPRGLSTWYAPFDHINIGARIVICGITPGIKQADAAIRAAAQALRADGDSLAAAKAAKETGSFAGTMRINLASMLDHIQINQLLNIGTCADLFGARRELVHYTSALRYPILKNGANYSGDRDMVSEPYLWDQSKTRLDEEMRALPNAIWIPLGQSVTNVFERLSAEGVIPQHQVLFGLPHASGANAERIKYFIGQKPREALSNKVNPNLIDQRKSEILRQIERLAAHSS